MEISEDAIRVLYIEDDKGLARLVQRRLERTNELSVSTAASAEQALQLLDKLLADHQVPDAVIIDYVLPDMNGIEALKQIVGKFPSIVAIIVTGAGDEDIAVEAMKHRAQDYIVKDANGNYLDKLPKLIKGLVAHQKLLVAQEKANRENRFLSAAVSQSSDAIIIFDDQGMANYANASLKKISGYAISEVIGKNPTLKDDCQWPFTHGIWRTVNSGQPVEEKIIERRKDGGFFPVMLTVAPIVNSNDVIEHYLVSMKDLTEYETLLAKFNQAQKMEAIGTLVGGIAHDFNNTLAGIIGNLYLIKKKITSLPDVVDKVTIVEKLCFHASGMIQQMLTFSRKGITTMKPMTASPFIKEIIKILQASVPENITMRYSISNSDMQIRGDINLLQQVLMNLINNAVDAVAKVNNPLVSVGLEPFTADKGFLQNHADLDGSDFACIKVTDNGCGISQKEMKHIFEPFFTTKGVGKGTGLGLAMAYGAIQSHHGVIEADSQPGKGCEFRIYLPLIRPGSEPVSAQAEKDVAKGQGETILIVDDNQGVIEATSAVLESLGYKVLTAYDGLDAISVYQTNMDTISLLIIDMVMPRLGGVDAAKAIRDLNPDVKVIFSTGYDRDNDLQDTAEAGTTTIVRKPFMVHELSHIIRKEILRS